MLGRVQENSMHLPEGQLSASDDLILFYETVLFFCSKLLRGCNICKTNADEYKQGRARAMG